MAATVLADFTKTGNYVVVSATNRITETFPLNDLYLKTINNSTTDLAIFQKSDYKGEFPIYQGSYANITTGGSDVPSSLADAITDLSEVFNGALA